MDLQFLLATGCCRCRSPPDVATPRASLLHRPVDEPQVHTVGKEVRVC